MLAATSGFAFLGFVAAIIGILAVRYLWRRKLPMHSAILFAAWGAISLSVVFFAFAFGSEVGPAAAALVFSITGIAAVLVNIEFRNARVRAAILPAVDPAARSSGFLRIALHFIAACALSGFAAFYAVIGFAACTSAGSPNLVIFSGFAMMTLWAALSVWAVTDRSVVRTFSILLALAGLGMALSRAGICG